MNSANQQVVSRRKRAVLVSAAFGAALTIGACMGSIGTGTGTGGNGNGTSSNGNGTSSNGNGTTGTGGQVVNPATTSTAGMPPPVMTSGTTGTPAPLDPGTIAAHRLNAFEYDNTVNDLLGLQQSVAESNFVADEEGANGFDNEADVFTMTDAEFTQYFNAADALGEQVFANPALVSRILTCTPASATDATLQTVR